MMKPYDATYWTGAKGSDIFAGVSLGFASLGALALVSFVLCSVANSAAWVAGLSFYPVSLIGLLFFTSKLKRRYHTLATTFQVMLWINFVCGILTFGGFLLLFSMSDL